MSVPLQSASLSPGFGLSWQLRVVTEICLESGYGVVDGVGGHTEYLRDRIHPELELELELESGKVVEKGVPLQSQDEDILSELESELGRWLERVSSYRNSLIHFLFYHCSYMFCWLP